MAVRPFGAGGTDLAGVVGVVVGVGVVAGEVVTGVPVDEPPPLDTVGEPVEPVEPVDPVAPVATVVGAVTAVTELGVVAVAVVVVVPPCGVNGLRERPASLELDCLVSTVIAGSAVPVEYGRPPLGWVTRLVGAFFESSTGTATRATTSTMAIGQSLRSRSSLIMLVRKLIGSAK